MSKMQTPGVYITEKNAFPNSVVEVATAVPAFIGYTEKAINDGKSLLNRPWRITSLAEYTQYFGGAPKPLFKLQKAEDGNYQPKRIDRYNLYYQMCLFFANGGGACYIVSVGEGYKQDDFSYNRLAEGINLLKKEQEPTMVLIPEAVYLEEEACFNLQVEMVRHCSEVKSRIAILDIYNGDKPRDYSETGDVITNFRRAIGINFLDYASAYYPWLNTSVTGVNDLDISVISNIDIIQELIRTEAASLREDKREQMLELAASLTAEGSEKSSRQREIHALLLSQIPAYAVIMKSIVDQLNLLPPAAAMAGIYTLVDNTKEVWKAPANVSLARVISPSVKISHSDQEDLNVPLTGKAVNAIRSFVGEGVLVWGARTLDGNSLDWRYINVRRTMIMLEQSIKSAIQAYVFEPNNANTWVNIRSMINNFLNGIWKRGGLAGASPEDAYSVRVGLGETMTAEDILDGIILVSVLVAISRPAEFIEITFRQQMQRS